MKELSLSALVAALVAGLVMYLGGLFGPDPKVAITVGLFQLSPTACQVLTFPASPQVYRGQEVEWTVAGGCIGINPDNLEVRFGQKAGDPSCSGDNPMDEGSLKGKKIKKNAKKDAALTRHCYGIYDGNIQLEDPDLEIRKKR